MPTSSTAELATTRRDVPRGIADAAVPGATALPPTLPAALNVIDVAGQL